MTVNELKVRQFRNLQAVDFVPDSGMNVICGENANGKTNLVEAIWLFTGAKSFRGNKDMQLPSFGCEKAKLTMDFYTGGVQKQAQLVIDQVRHASLNGKKLSSGGALAGAFRAIVFSPADLGLVTDGPAVRRRFLDIALCQMYPVYLEHLRQYNRAVTQRNALLKEMRKSPANDGMLDGFEENIAVHGAKLLQFRTDYIRQIEPLVGHIYAGLSTEKEVLHLSYCATASADTLARALKEARKEDRYTFTTSVGPHRDELEFTVNGMSARSFGSQGQKRSVALALKLSEAELMKTITGEYPVAILDDVMSELDPTRQRYVLNHIKGWQVFLTCCDPSNTAGMTAGKLFWMKNGVLEG